MPTRPSHRRGTDCGCAGRQRTPSRPEHQPSVDRVGVGGVQPPEDLGQSVGVAPDRHFPVAAALATPPHCIEVGAGHDSVDITTQPTLGDSRPPSHLYRQRRIDGGQHVGVGDQIGAVDNRLKRPVIDIAGHQQRTHTRQPQPHCPRVVQITVRHPAGDAQRGGNLVSDRVMGVGAPGLALTKMPQPQKV